MAPDTASTPSPAEKEPARLRQYAEESAAVDALFRQALREKGSAALAEFCNFLRRFRRYSLFNGMLIRMQRPGAQAVAPPGRWAKLGRTINPDSVPIVILRPFGPVAFVYELGDTSGRPVPGSTFDPLGATGTVHPSTWERTVKRAEKAGIAVGLVATYGAGLAGTAAALHATAHARTEAGGDGEARWRVRVNHALDLPSRYLTLAHELAHIYCGHIGGDRKGRWPDRQGRLTPGQQELEAEASAYLVCARAGIETRSAEYLAMHARPGDLETISLFAVVTAADSIEARGNGKSQ